MRDERPLPPGELLDLDRRHVWHPYASMPGTAEPLVVESAAGVRLRLAEPAFGQRELVERLRAEGVPAVWGDATEPAVLIQAHVRDAKTLVIATPQTVQVRRMVETARTLNPSIEVVVRYSFLMAS